MATVARRAQPGDADDIDALTEALAGVSRTLMGVTARSLGAVDVEVTLVQFRALVVLRTAGSRNLGQMADALGIQSSSMSRLGDRLFAKGLIDRRTSPTDRREVALALTLEGRRMVDRVLQRRRREIAKIVSDIPSPQRRVLIDALRRFSEAAGEGGTGGVPEGSSGFATV
jgi:DNA-binding MarR family transcriptional regulator